MRHFKFTIALIFILSFSMHSQVLDTLVDVGGYNMRFNIIKGEGAPILFESGAGNDGSVWNNILEPIHRVTGTTLITYDRSGFGKSELNPNETDDSKFGFINGIEELETGLKKLGYDKDIILVSHSFGGLYNLLYASRHPNTVKSIVFIDVLLNTITSDKKLDRYDLSPPLKENYKENMGLYYFAKNIRETIILMRSIEYPTNIPIVSLYAERTNRKDSVHQKRWNMIHKGFSNGRPNVTTINAQGSGHYIYNDNPSLAINTIIKAYSETLNEDRQNAVLKKALNSAIVLSVEAKKIEMEYLHSRKDLNRWGYSMLRNGEIEKALLIFKLNTLLNPDDWRAIDSYADGLMNANRDIEAIEMYEKSIELNPDNKNSKKMLKIIKERN